MQEEQAARKAELEELQRQLKKDETEKPSEGKAFFPKEKVTGGDSDSSVESDGEEDPIVSSQSQEQEIVQDSSEEETDALAWAKDAGKLESARRLFPDVAMGESDWFGNWDFTSTDEECC